jgi:hypothetical protein
VRGNAIGGRKRILKSFCYDCARSDQPVPPQSEYLAVRGHAAVSWFIRGQDSELKRSGDTQVLLDAGLRVTFVSAFSIGRRLAERLT